MASDEMPWASGVLRGSGRLAACAQGIAARKIATIDAEKSALSFMPRCLSVRDRGVNFLKSHRFQSTLEQLRIVRVNPMLHVFAQLLRESYHLVALFLSARACSG